MTKLRPIDFYNAWMNDESSSYPHGSWHTYEDMQIAALCAAMATLFVHDEGKGPIIYVEDLQDLISQLEIQSNKLKEKHND